MYDRKQIPLLSLADICRQICEQMGGTIIDHEGRYITFSYPGFLYSRNFILDASESEIEPILREIHENLAQGLPGGISFTSEFVPENMNELLEKNGFQPFISQTGMIFDLSKSFPEEEDEKLKLMTDDQMIDWSKAVADGFPKPYEDAPYIALNKTENVLTYGYMEDGQIASTGMLLIDPELSGIHEISTLTPFRGQGHARLIILRMLKDLKERGISSVSLQASDMGRDHVYLALGFETVSTIPTWVPSP